MFGSKNKKKHPEKGKMIRLDGKRYMYRPYDEHVIKEAHGYYRLLQPPTRDDVWLDVGGHVGSFSIRMHDEVGQLYAYEPDTENLRTFLKNLSLNGTPDNVEVTQAAIVGESRESVRLYRNSGHFTSTHMIYPRRGRKFIEIPAVHIDEALEQTGANKVKLDCECAEVEIIHNMQRWDQVDELVFEYHFAMLKDEDYSIFNSLLDVLRQHFPEENMTYPKTKNNRWTTIVHAWRPAA